MVAKKLCPTREMAIGNTFGATALSSYGGFWISFAIILTPGGFQIESELAAASPNAFADEFGLYLMGWFIFTFLLVLCTLRSTVAFFSLFFSLDLAFLLLGIGYLHRDAMDMPNAPIIKAGGFFALLAAFLAWYNALAGMADDSNRYAIIRYVYIHCCCFAVGPQHVVAGRSRKCKKLRNRVLTHLFFRTASSSFQWRTSHGR